MQEETVSKIVVNTNESLTDELSDKEKELMTKLNDESSKLDVLKEAYRKMKEKNPNATCPSCGGMRMGNKVCEVCGAGSAKEKIVMKQEVMMETAEKLFIPNHYVNKVFDAQKVREQHPSLSGTKELENYLSMLSLITDQLNNKYTQLSSLFISAPPGFGKEHFAYSLLQIAVTNGMTVFPYLDLGEVNRLVSAYERNNTKDITKDIKFTDVDLYTAKVCVLKVPHSDNFESYKTALKIIDRRARRGLSTIILSRYNFKFFTSYDTFGEMKSLVKYDAVSPKNVRVIEMSARVNSL